MQDSLKKTFGEIQSHCTNSVAGDNMPHLIVKKKLVKFAKQAVSILFEINPDQWKEMNLFINTLSGLSGGRRHLRVRQSDVKSLVTMLKVQAGDERSFDEIYASLALEKEPVPSQYDSPYSEQIAKSKLEKSETLDSEAKERTVKVFDLLTSMQSGTAEHIDLNVADWGYGIGNETTQIARLISGVNMVFNLAERQIDCEEAAVFFSQYNEDEQHHRNKVGSLLGFSDLSNSFRSQIAAFAANLTLARHDQSFYFGLGGPQRGGTRERGSAEKLSTVTQQGQYDPTTKLDSRHQQLSALTRTVAGVPTQSILEVVAESMLESIRDKEAEKEYAVGLHDEMLEKRGSFPSGASRAAQKTTSPDSPFRAIVTAGHAQQTNNIYLANDLALSQLYHDVVNHPDINAFYANQLDELTDVDATLQSALRVHRDSLSETQKASLFTKDHATEYLVPLFTEAFKKCIG